jgi:hypothetical protein
MAHRQRKLGCVIVARGEADLKVGALATRWGACGWDCGLFVRGHWGLPRPQHDRRMHVGIQRSGIATWWWRG